jgi:hypothetical protein
MLFGGDAKRLEEGQIVVRERAIGRLVARISGGFLLVVDFVEAYGGFEHEHDVEALLADLAHNGGNLVRIAHGFMDCFAKFLDKVFDLLIQRHLPVVPWNPLTTHWVFPKAQRERHLRGNAALRLRRAGHLAKPPLWQTGLNF